MIYIGIDNGVSGSIGAVDSDGGAGAVCFKTPITKCLNYTKSKRFISRIDIGKMAVILTNLGLHNLAFVLLERPMLNPMRFQASVSAMRALEATLIRIESLGLAYSYIDSREWQKALLPSGLKGPELKLAGIEVCKRLFPKLELPKGCDADGVLIAEYCRRIKK